MITHQQRSQHIVNWINSHPLINVHQLCQMAGYTNSSNFNRALNDNGRMVSKKYIQVFENILKDYGYVPLR